MSLIKKNLIKLEDLLNNVPSIISTYDNVFIDTNKYKLNYTLDSVNSKDYFVFTRYISIPINKLKTRDLSELIFKISLEYLNIISKFEEFINNRVIEKHMDNYLLRPLLFKRSFKLKNAYIFEFDGGIKVNN